MLTWDLITASVCKGIFPAISNYLELKDVSFRLQERAWHFFPNGSRAYTEERFRFCSCVLGILQNIRRSQKVATRGEMVHEAIFLSLTFLISNAPAQNKPTYGPNLEGFRYPYPVKMHAFESQERISCHRAP
jgi:hypothetical protein